MNEILSIDIDLDWVDGLCEPGELIWIGDSWSFADNPLGTAVHEAVSGLDMQGCSTLQNDFERQRFFNIGECSPFAVFTRSAGVNRLIDAAA